MITDTDNTTQRLLWIDVLKGMAIFFVVLGHSPYLSHLPPKVFNVIFSFHMPLFFFIAGYLFNLDFTASDLVRKRFNTLLKPYLFTLVLISLTCIIFKSGTSPWWYLFWIIYGNGPNLPKLALHLWFLPHLFLTTAIVWTIFKLFKTLKNSIAVISLLICMFLILGTLSIHIFWNITIADSITNSFMKNTSIFLASGLLDNPAYAKDVASQDHQFILKGLPWSLDIIFISAAFFVMGYVVKKLNYGKVFLKHFIAIPVFILFIILHCAYNDTIDLNLRRYDSLFICTFLAITGIYMCIYLAHAIANVNNRITKYIGYIGRYSLIVYIFHLFIQSKVYLAIIAVFPNKAGIAFLPALAAGIGLPLLLNLLLLERFKFFRLWYYAR